MPPDSLVVLSDGRDVITNIHNVKNYSQHLHLYSSISNFRESFESLTEHSPGSIVASTEAQCCVTALGYARPGDLFASDGTRSGRACSAKSSTCKWNGEEEAAPWQRFMEEQARKKGKGSLSDVYLNAGLVAGKAKDLLSVIKAMDIDEKEDDQAVLTALFYKNPNSIMLGEFGFCCC